MTPNEEALMRIMTVVSILFLSLFGSACGPKLIPGLDIEVADTPDNRALIAVMEKFQRAYEKQDVGALVDLASTKFYESSGSADTEDDYNYEGLRTHFVEHFKLIQKCTLNMTLKDVSVAGNQAFIDYRFLTRYQMKLPSGEQWKILDNINRMQLVKENGQWKVLSGF
jgi:hypothetical protein